MNQFMNESKRLLKKIEQKNMELADINQLITLCNEKVCDFHLYSLGMKYYSYLERNHDVEDDLDVDLEDYVKYDQKYEQGDEESDEIVQGEEIGHVHDESCNHDHDDHDHDDHEHHDHEHHEKLTCDSMDLLKETFEDFMKHFTKTGQLPTVNELLDLRHELSEHVTALTAYGDQISMLENVYYKSRYNEEKMISMESDEAFSQNVVEQLMATENSADIREHLKYIYPELPMRMTNNRFFSFVDAYFDKLKGIPTVDVKKHIQIIKETFDPRFAEGYGEIAPEIANEIEKVKEIFITGDQNAKDSGYHYLYHLTEEKNEILEIGLDIAELLNHLLALVLCNLDIEESRVYKIVSPLLNGERSPTALADVFEDVELNYEPLGEAMTTVDTLIDHVDQDKDLLEEFDRTFLINELKFAFELTKEGYFIDRPYRKDDTVSSLKELNMIKNDLIGQMEEVLSNDDRIIRRSRMSIMMSIFQIVHATGQEIYDHIYSSISNCKIKGEKVMSMQNIYSYLNDFIE